MVNKSPAKTRIRITSCSTFTVMRAHTDCNGDLQWDSRTCCLHAAIEIFLAAHRLSRACGLVLGLGSLEGHLRRARLARALRVRGRHALVVLMLLLRSQLHAALLLLLRLVRGRHALLHLHSREPDVSILIGIDQPLAAAQQCLISYQSLRTCQQSLHDKDPEIPESPRIYTSAAPLQHQGRQFTYLVPSRSHSSMLYVQILH